MLSLDYQPDQNGTATVVVRHGYHHPAGLFVEETIVIDVDAVNDAPVITGGSFVIDEHSPPGTSVGTVFVNDIDAGDSATFSIVGATVPGAFSIDAATGEITVSDSLLIDLR